VLIASTASCELARSNYTKPDYCNFQSNLRGSVFQEYSVYKRKAAAWLALCAVLLPLDNEHLGHDYAAVQSKPGKFESRPEARPKYQQPET